MKEGDIDQSSSKQVAPSLISL